MRELHKLVDMLLTTRTHEWDTVIRQYLERKARELDSQSVSDLNDIRQILGLERKESAESCDCTADTKNLDCKKHNLKPSPVAERVWPCEHIQFIKRGKAHAAQGDYWGFLLSGHHQNICNGWIECPICLKPRPDEKLRTLEEVFIDLNDTNSRKGDMFSCSEYANAGLKWFRKKVESVNANCHGVQFKGALLGKIAP